MSEALVEYFEALERIFSNQPIRVPKGTTISNDSVAQEAGRGKGSIKKSREVFKLLIEEITAKAALQAQNSNPIKERLEKKTIELARVRYELDEALAREVNLIQEIFKLKMRIAQLTGDKVLPLRRPKSETPDSE